jgi:hypothetical protein
MFTIAGIRLCEDIRLAPFALTIPFDIQVQPTIAVDPDTGWTGTEALVPRAIAIGGPYIPPLPGEVDCLSGKGGRSGGEDEEQDQGREN